MTTIESCSSSAGFRQFNLQPAIERGVAEAGFTEPRPILVLTIPAALAGRDVLGLAQTGTGKTAAFALPILERLSSERRAGPRALVLAPPRELATQIHADFQTLARFTQDKEWFREACEKTDYSITRWLQFFNISYLKEAGVKNQEDDHSHCSADNGLCEKDFSV